MTIERIKKFFEFQRRSVHGPVPLWGVLNGIFILYPIAFFMFMAGGLEVLKNEELYQGLLIAGIVVWILNLVFLLDLKRGILTSFGTYLMYLTGHVYTIIGFSSLSGDHNFIVLKLSLPLIYAIVIIIVMSCLVDLDSEEIIPEKSGKIMLNFVVGPIILLSLCFIFLAIIGYDFLMGWGVVSILCMTIYFMFFYNKIFQRGKIINNLFRQLNKELENKDI